jgi:hypothetical protein
MLRSARCITSSTVSPGITVAVPIDASSLTRVPPRSSGLAAMQRPIRSAGLDRAIMVEMIEMRANSSPPMRAGYVRRADQAAEQPGNMDQGRIAGKMAVQVVYGLEAVEVHIQHSRRRAVPLGLRRDPLQLTHETPTVGQRRQRIGVRQLLQLFQPHLGLGQRSRKQCILIGELADQGLHLRAKLQALKA